MGTRQPFDARRAAAITTDVSTSTYEKNAARGYGYVAVSRFSTRQGCYLFGKLRRTDFLPVGEEREDEVLERKDFESMSSCSDSEGSMSGGLQYVGSSILAGDCDSPAPGDAADKDSGEDAVDDFAAGGMSDDLPTVGSTVAAGAVDARTVSGETEAEEDTVDDFCI